MALNKTTISQNVKETLANFKAPQETNKIKNNMFNVIKNAKYMRIDRTAQGTAIGFAGRVAFIARVHQYGLKDKISRFGPNVQYSRRELLGFTDEDINMIENDILNYISSK